MDFDSVGNSIDRNCQKATEVGVKDKPIAVLCSFFKKTVCVLVLCLLPLQEVLAYAVAPVAKIAIAENGWFGEGLAIQLDSGGVSGCGTPLAFGIDAGHPAYKDLVAISLAALTSGSSVELVVDQGVCVFGGRTKVISIRLRK